MIPSLRPSAVLLAALLGAMPAAGLAQESVAFPTADGGTVHGDLYGSGDRAVVLAHGGRFSKESWADQAKAMAEAGFRVLAIDFRGYGESKGPGDDDPMGAPLHQDVLAAVRHLRRAGATSVSVVGGSLGGSAAADAAIAARPGEIDRLVVLSATALGPPELISARTLLLVARGDTTASGVPRLVAIRRQYDLLPEPKELVVVDGSAHAQHLFATDQGARVMGEILRFLTAP